MLYCKIHHRLYVGDLQKWISFSDDDIKKLNATIIEGACNECVAVAKEELKKTFPVLYASLSNL
jgi:hypothetical protein